jgi:2-amino-4-hydroxy-6-hydroxymethyldihydropteridine diphosphokinase
VNKIHRNRFLFALGSNGSADPNENRRHVDEALARLGEAGFQVTAVSRYWRTPAFPAGAGPDFVNACGVAEADLDPTAALQALHAIEAAMGRVRSLRWGQRVIDIDLLAVGDLVLPDGATWRHWHEMPPADQQEQAPEGLILPHPRIQDRGFVLVPLAEVAPDWVHPVLGLTVAQMLAARPAAETGEIVPI